MNPQDNRRRIAIVGATSGIACACARLWVSQKPTDMILVGRDKERLERIGADLKCHSAHTDVSVFEASFLDPLSIQTVVNTIFAQGAVDIVLIAQGSLPEQITCQNDLKACAEALSINAISPVLFSEAFAQHMTHANKGTIAIIGSVAGDRGRKSNYIYGSAKGSLDQYTEGLAHRWAGHNVHVTLIKPGPTDTPMTRDMKQRHVNLADVRTVAEDIIHGLDRKKNVIYTPKKWGLIMLIIRHLPRWIFNRLNI